MHNVTAMSQILSIFRRATLAITVSGSAGLAQQIPENVLRAEVLDGWRTASGTHMAALRLTLAEGWKTYWRAPGEGGIPPSFDWSGSANIASVAFHWPRPDVFDINGLRTIGYHDELVLPMEFTAREADAPMSVTARIALGVCEDICIPVEVSVIADLPRQSTVDPAIEVALAQQPLRGKRTGVKAIHCTAEPIKDGLRLTARIDIPTTGAEEVVVFELADRSIWISQADSWREGRELVSVADIVPPSSQPFVLNRDEVRVTILGTDQAVELRGCPG